jgi:hypothetical protein
MERTARQQTLDDEHDDELGKISSKEKQTNHGNPNKQKMFNYSFDLV